MTVPDVALDPIDRSRMAPAPPRSLSGTVSGGVANLQWTAPDLQQGGVPSEYRLEVGPTPGTTLMAVVTPGTKYSATGVPPGRYVARVRAANANGVSPPSNEIALVVGAHGDAVPGVPTNLTSFVIGTTTHVQWAAGAAGGAALGYVVEVGTAPGLANLARVTVSAERSFVYDAVPTGVFYVRVRGYNAAGVGDPSADHMLVAGDTASPPHAPSNFAASANAARVVSLGWTAPRGAITRYLISVALAPGGTPFTTVDTGSSLTQLQVPNVPAGTYYLRIRAANGQGMSLPSDEIELRVR
jgi:predicted phage tail protein